MQDKPPLERVMDLVKDLRVRCPWDRVQTRETLRPYLVEEVLELDQAVAHGDREAVREELGDFMLHLAWQLVLSEEEGSGSADELATRVVRKMERRHPHLFDLGPREPWELLKRREKRGGVLDGLPATLPDLLMAFRLQERVASVGFDWPDAEGPLAKVREEIAEFEEELPGGDADRLTDELGDLLFAVVNLARKAGVQPGAALDRANRKFQRRFQAVEALARERGIPMETAGLEALDLLWDEVKAAQG
ncbi:MAG TPA: nucleoside triphosphate pyrophosphohydrolase [Gemmatimonadales bacterium]|jgi:MazG family protein|nr:nucleoside triphosphate pyrophosphohydrolase [Gemmatimonadales bacterium]